MIFIYRDRIEAGAKALYDAETEELGDPTGLT